MAFLPNRRQTIFWTRDLVSLDGLKRRKYLYSHSGKIFFIFWHGKYHGCWRPNITENHYISRYAVYFYALCVPLTWKKGHNKKAFESAVIFTETITNKWLLCKSNIRLFISSVLDLMECVYENMISECRYRLDLTSNDFPWQDGDTIVWVIKYQQIHCWPYHTDVLIFIIISES